MSTFNAGDRVRLIENAGDNSSPAKVGDEGVVESVSVATDLTRVRMADGHLTGRYANRWAKVETPLAKPGDVVRLKVTGTLDEDGDLDFGPDFIEKGAFVESVEVPKVTVEVVGRVVEARFGPRVEFDGSSSILAEYLSGEAFEVLSVEPPVEPFKPGDVVRRKTGTRYTYLIGEKSSVVLNGSPAGTTYPHRERSIAEIFSPASYDLVTAE